METNIYYRLINYLIDFGKLVAETTKGIVDIMTTPYIKGIGGNYTILEFMLGSFFVVYVPYQIIKWIIP